MHKRLLAAWKTYWTRPFVLVLGLLWVALLVAPLMSGGLTNDVRRWHPEVEMPRSSIERVDELDQVRQSGQQSDVRGLRLDRLSRDLTRRNSTWDEERKSWVASGDPAQMDTLEFIEEFPNLKALTYDNLILLPEDLERLSRCTQLTQLSLSGVRLYEKRTEPDAVGGRLRELNGDDLGVVAGLKQLEVLDLSGLDITGKLEPLSRLPKLDTLILSRFEHLNDATLADLWHLPHLKSLMIAPVYADRRPTNHKDSVTDTGLRSLAEVPELETIFVGFHGPFTVPVTKLQERLPGVRVRRGYYSQERVAISGWLPFFIAIVTTTLLSLHTQMMYAQPSAYLLPRFSPAQQILPCLLLTVTIVGVTSSLCARDASVLPSLGLATFWPAVFLWCSRGYNSRNRLQQQGSGYLASLGPLVIVLAVILTIGSIVRFPVEFDAFLLADTAWSISAAFLSVSLITLVRWTRNLPKLAQGIASTDARAIMSWDDLSINKTLLRQLESGGDSRVDGMYRRSDQFVEKVLRHATSGSWGQLQFWRAGVPRVGLRSAMVAVVMGVMMTYRSWFEVYRSGTLTSDVVTSRDWMGGVIVSLIVVGMVLYRWRIRMPGMASESLRPLTRETIRRLTFLATLLDMLPPLLVSLGWMILACILSPPEMIPGMLSIWIVCVIALYAFLMWMQLINRLWGIAVALLACYLVASGVGIGLVALRHSTDDFNLTPADLVTIAAVLFVLAALGLAYAWRRWGTVEFGMLDR